MRQRTVCVAFGIVLASLLIVFSPAATAAHDPAVTALIEGRDVASGRSTLVLVGKGMTRFTSFVLRDGNGADVGPVETAGRTPAMLVLQLPAGTPLGAYDLVLGFGKTGSQVRHVVLTNGTGNPPGTPTLVSVVQSVPVAVSSSPSNSVVVPAELNGVNLTADTTSAEIDCDGYRAVSLFISYDAFTLGPGDSAVVPRIEFLCNGTWSRLTGGSALGLGAVSPYLVTADVLGPKMRVRFERLSPSLSFPPINNTKVGIYLRR